MNIIQEIKNFVKTECKKPESTYGYDAFIYHFIPMAKYSEKLTDELGGDKEIVLLAAWLHDIGSIRHGRKDHHLTGAKIAEQKLKDLEYPAEKIELIKRCILHHRGSQHSTRESIEEKIIAEADTLACFDDIPGIFQAAFCWEGHKSRESAKIAVKEKLERKWNQLHFEQSKKMIKPKYEAIMLLLE